jgi:hypothetical protein
MAAFMIFRIRFKEKRFEKDFIKKYQPIILINDDTDSDWSAWLYLWKPNTLICFMDSMGYDEPKEIKKLLKGKIKYFDWIPINDLNARWGKDNEVK